MAQQIFTNGIDATTGGPLDGDMVITTEMLAKVARGQRLTPDDLRDAKIRKNIDDSKKQNFGTVEGVDDTNLAEAGWSVIFPSSLPQKSVDGIKEALKPLLDLRKEQASKNKDYYYKEVIGPDLGYKAGENKNDFLKRFGRGPGAADPEKFPYYALIVGSPETIPFTFQYQLDVQYAVGRIYFEQLEDYYRYATSVVAAETGKIARARRAAFFGMQNPGDPATNLSATTLVRPLANDTQKDYKNWTVDLVDPQNATKANLAKGDASQAGGGTTADGSLLKTTHPVNFAMTAGGGDLATPSAFKITGLKGKDFPLYKSARSATQSFECSSCHAVHDNENVPFLRDTNSGSKLCLGCHNK